MITDVVCCDLDGTLLAPDVDRLSEYSGVMLLSH